MTTRFEGTGSEATSALSPKSAPWNRMDGVVVLILFALSGLLFWESFGNGLYIGNPDRLNSNLKILKFYVDGMRQGHLDAWSPFEMLGYDTFTLPYTFPSLFVLMGYFTSASRLYVVAGYEVIGLLGLSGVAAYAFLRVEIRIAFPAMIGAILYEFSALTTLKASQNDLSFAVFIFIPVIMLAVKSIARGRLRFCFVTLSVMILLLLHFTFLQKASYALLFAGGYALYLGFVRRDWRVVVVYGAACVVGIIGAFPRLYGIAVAIQEYSRVVGGVHFDRFADVYKFQAIFPLQMLRWFDGGIFGRFPSDGTSNLGNPINLTEGFLLYTSAFVPFLAGYGLFRYGRRPFEMVYSPRNDIAFFFWFMCFTFSVIAFPFMLELVWLLYMRMDFTHARILIVGLLPLSVVVAAVLAELVPEREPSEGWSISSWIAAGGLALLLVGGIEFVSRRVLGETLVGFLSPGMHVLHSALARIALSALALAALLAAIRPRVNIRWFERWGAGGSVVRNVLYLTLGLSIGLQTFVGAYYQTNGAHTRAPPPFLDGNIHYSNKDNFRPPSPAAVAALSDRLDNGNFRSALLCDERIAGGFCAGHIPEFWRLRVVDGYYGLGVPTRLASLPWKQGLSLRTISFTKPEDLDWPLLSILNVKYAARIPESLYRNNSAGPGEPRKAADPNDVELIPNPLPVTPRYFFTRQIVAVTGLAEAASRLVGDDKRPADLARTSFAETAFLQREYATGRIVSAKGDGDHITLEVTPSDSERFLVANELYFPGWSALVDGRTAIVYPTNAVMRGVLVPPGTSTLELIYTPVVRRNTSWFFYGGALLLLSAGAVLFGRSKRGLLP